MNQKAREKAPTKTRLIHEPFSRRDRIMRWSAWLLFFSFGMIGCGSEMHQKIKLDIPAYSPLKLEEYKEIVLVPFLLEENKKEEAPSAKESGPSGPEEAKAKKEEQDWKAAAELVSYFASELRRRFPGQVRIYEAPLARADVIRSADYWPSLFPKATSTLIFTGHGRFQQEVRKAILYRTQLTEEDFLGPEKGLASRAVFTLELTLALINPTSGEILLERSFKENKTTPDLLYPGRFALFELSQRIKFYLFRALFGEERPQERYLLLK